MAGAERRAAEAAEPERPKRHGKMRIIITDGIFGTVFRYANLLLYLLIEFSAPAPRAASPASAVSTAIVFSPCRIASDIYSIPAMELN